VIRDCGLKPDEPFGLFSIFDRLFEADPLPLEFGWPLGFLFWPRIRGGLPVPWLFRIREALLPFGFPLFGLPPFGLPRFPNRLVPFWLLRILGSIFGGPIGPLLEPVLPPSTEPTLVFKRLFPFGMLLVLFVPIFGGPTGLLLVPVVDRGPVPFVWPPRIEPMPPFPVPLLPVPVELLPIRPF